MTAAAFEGSASIIQTLINAGANTNVVMKDGHTPLTIAAQKNCPKVIDLLIRWGCDVNTAESEQDTHNWGFKMANEKILIDNNNK